MYINTWFWKLDPLKFLAPGSQSGPLEWGQGMCMFRNKVFPGDWDHLPSSGHLRWDTLTRRNDCDSQEETTSGHCAMRVPPQHRWSLPCPPHSSQHRIGSQASTERLPGGKSSSPGKFYECPGQRQPHRIIPSYSTGAGRGPCFLPSSSLLLLWLPGSSKNKKLN